MSIVVQLKRYKFRCTITVFIKVNDQRDRFFEISPNLHQYILDQIKEIEHYSHETSAQIRVTRMNDWGINYDGFSKVMTFRGPLGYVSNDVYPTKVANGSDLPKHLFNYQDFKKFITDLKNALQEAQK